MSGKPTKMKAYDSFLDWKEDQTKPNQQIIEALQKLIETAAPHFTATVKWGQGCWTDDGDPRVYLHAEDDHVQLGFYSGSSLDDPYGLLMGNGKYVRFVKVSSVEGIDAARFAALIAQVS